MAITPLETVLSAFFTSAIAFIEGPERKSILLLGVSGFQSLLLIDRFIGGNLSPDSERSSRRTT
jgi:hypothetical protein